MALAGSEAHHDGWSIWRAIRLQTDCVGGRRGAGPPKQGQATAPDCERLGSALGVKWDGGLPLTARTEALSDNCLDGRRCCRRTAAKWSGRYGNRVVNKPQANSAATS